MTETEPPREATAAMAAHEVQRVLTQVGQGVDSLVPRSKARFLPDSLVGSITIEVDGEEATFYFLADEEDRKRQKQPVAPAIGEAIGTFSVMSNRLLKKKGG
jgi:hypothetical protein